METPSKFIPDFKEIGITWIQGDKNLTISSSVPVWTRRILALKQKYPKDVEIRAENKDGSICVHFPAHWLRITVPKAMTEENKAKAREQMLKIRKEMENKNNE